VWRSSRDEHRFSGNDAARLAASCEGDLAFKDVEELILGEMAMRRRPSADANYAVQCEH